MTITPLSPSNLEDEFGSSDAEGDWEGKQDGAGEVEEEEEEAGAVAECSPQERIGFFKG